jgi:glutathione synthase
MKVAFQMDPIKKVDPKADSTFRIAEEAQLRGHLLFYYEPNKLTSENGKAIASGHFFKIIGKENGSVQLGPEEVVELSEFDVVWLRQDPPFDMHYITTTFILDALKPQTLVVNDPFWVRNLPEKLLVLNFPELIPPTSITRNIDVLKAFKEKYGDIIVKPLYGNGGTGVLRLNLDDQNLESIVEMYANFSREPLVAQQFLPQVTRGDKRIILVDGYPVGAINRVPISGEIRSNMHVGGTATKIGLSERDIEICNTIGPTLREKGQIFVGIDVIGDFLTEINVTSPTGLHELERFDGINAASIIWNAIDEKLKV